MKIVDIHSFGKLNPTLSMNVFEYATDEDYAYEYIPLYISENNENRRSIDLILYKNH